MQKISWMQWMLAAALVSLGWGGAGCLAGQPSPFFQNIKTSALSGDATLLAVAQGDDRNDVALIGTATGRTLRVLKGCGCTVDSVAFSPDGRLLATYATVCSGDTYHWEAKLWDVRTGRLRHTLEAPDIGPVKSGPYALGFTSGGLLAATTDGDSYVRLWDARTGRLRRLGQREQFFFSSDGVVVPMTPALASILKTFPLTTPLEFTTVSLDKRRLLTISGITTVEGIVTAADGPGKAAVLWDAETGRKLRSFPLDGHCAYCASMSGGQVLISGGDFAQVWDLGRGVAQQLWRAASSPDRFDRFGHSHVVWARLVLGGKQADLISIHLKPVVYKNPRQDHAVWYTEEGSFMEVDAVTGRRMALFALKAW